MDWIRVCDTEQVTGAYRSAAVCGATAKNAVLTGESGIARPREHYGGRVIAYLMPSAAMRSRMCCARASDAG